MIICPNCRAKLGDGSSTCVVCGTPLGGSSTTPKAPEPAQAAAPAVAATAPAVAADPVSPKVDLAARPMEEKPLPRDELLEEAKPQAAPSAPQPQKPAQALPPQAPPPPDHPMYQQQQQQYQQYPAGYYPVQPATNWETHPYTPGQPNQCPRCHNMNIVTFYDNGTAVCGACYYKYYWRAAGDPFSSVGREFNKLWG
jgi:hypothetical protein